MNVKLFLVWTTNKNDLQISHAWYHCPWYHCFILPLVRHHIDDRVFAHYNEDNDRVDYIVPGTEISCV